MFPVAWQCATIPRIQQSKATVSRYQEIGAVWPVAIPGRRQDEACDVF